ncbi:putative quorum-quenching lactonase YtnP [termite gut metagenome]|uniref:Putative quorum-quenching lactonase YtnP n=1 Tax=termite gut metagenome TaxID=433724 RepID=A0A5J4QRI5_9ZZZZ
MKKYLLSLVCSLFVCSIVAAQEDETVITYEIGAFQISTLSEGGQDVGSNLLVGTTPEMLRKHLPDGTFPLEIQSFLVRTPDKTVLVDAGVGRNLFKNLQSLGVSEEQINVILLTHMHGDHIGGLLRDEKAAFPHAELYFSQVEYDYWVNEKERGAGARKIIDAYKDKLHLFVPAAIEDASQWLFPGFRAVTAYGHTPGHTAYFVESEKSKLLIWGDITHATPIQMPHPEVTLTFDSNPEQAAQTRKSILEYVAKNRIRVAGAHIKFPAIGNVVKGAEERYEFIAICTCEAL